MRGQASTRKRTIRPWPTSRSGRRTGEVPDGRAADAGDRGLHLRRRRTAGVVPAERSDCGAHSCPPSPYLPPPPPPAPPRTPAGGNPAGRAGRGRTAPLTDARGGVRRGQGANLRGRLLGIGAKRPAGGGDRGLRPLRGRARPVCPRGRSPRVPRNRRVERDREPV